MRVRRDISAIPLRSGTETWDQIVKLITGASTRDGECLTAARGVMASVIADEHPAKRPFVLEGVGAQLRIYCRFGTDAIEAGESVDALTWNPTAGEWILSVPCDSENIGWVRKSLARTSPRFKVFDVEKEERAFDTEDTAISKTPGIVVDWDIKS